MTRQLLLINTKFDCTVYRQSKLDHLLNWPGKELAFKPSQGGQGNERPPGLILAVIFLIKVLRVGT